MGDILIVIVHEKYGLTLLWIWIEEGIRKEVGKSSAVKVRAFGRIGIQV
jgi:hypothetical protein